MVELPFEDCPEAVEVHSKYPNLNKEIRCEEWRAFKEKGEYLYFPYESYTKTKIFVLDACNKFQANCTEEIKSFDDLLKGFDAVIRKIKEGK